MSPLNTLIERFSRWGAFLSGLLLVLIVILISVEILLRSVFNISTLISDEYSAYFFVGVVFMGLAYTMKEGGHIKITLITSLLGKRTKAILEIFTSLLAVILTTYALYHTTIMVYQSWQLGIQADTISETPIYLSQLLIPVGLLLLDLQILTRIARKVL